MRYVGNGGWTFARLPEGPGVVWFGPFPGMTTDSAPGSPWRYPPLLVPALDGGHERYNVRADAREPAMKIVALIDLYRIPSNHVASLLDGGHRTDSTTKRVRRLAGYARRELRARRALPWWCFPDQPPPRWLEHPKIAVALDRWLQEGREYAAKHVHAETMYRQGRSPGRPGAM